MIIMTPTQVKWINVALFCVAMVTLMLVYCVVIFSGPCGWRRLHKIYGRTENVPVFVTSGDSKTYETSKQFLQEIYRVQNPRYYGLQVIYIDLGLTKDQLNDLEELCGPCECVIKQIPRLSEILKSTDLDQGFTETMIMSVVYNEYPFFMWIDSSTKINSSAIFTELFTKTIKNGIQVAVGNGLIDDDFGLTPEHFKILGENPIYYTSKRILDTSWMLVGEVTARLEKILTDYFICVERSLCFRKNWSTLCLSGQKIYSVRQCQAILAVQLNKEFDDCYRSYAFSFERYVLMENSTCEISAAVGY